MSKRNTNPTPLIPIPEDQLLNQIGEIIHVRGMNPACCWRLMSVRDGQMFLETPKTKEPLGWVRADRALYSRRNEPVKEATNGNS